MKQHRHIVPIKQEWIGPMGFIKPIKDWFKLNNIKAEFVEINDDNKNNTRVGFSFNNTSDAILFKISFRP